MTQIEINQQVRELSALDPTGKLAYGRMRSFESVSVIPPLLFPGIDPSSSPGTILPDSTVLDFFSHTGYPYYFAAEKEKKVGWRFRIGQQCFVVVRLLVKKDLDDRYGWNAHEGAGCFFEGVTD